MGTVATAAGVSGMTVSRALREDAHLPVATRRRIQAIAAKLGYRPDPAVSQLMARLRVSRTKTPETIAWINPRPLLPDGRDAPSMQDFFQGAAGRAAQLGYKLEIIAGHERGMSARRLTSILLARGVAGVLVAPLPGVPETVALDWSCFAAATYGYTVAEPALHRACNHHLRIIRRALAEVVRRGYRRPGLIVSRTDNARVDEGWTAGFLAFRLHLAPAQRVPVLLYEKNSAATTAVWLKQHRPDVILAHAMEDFEAVRATGRQVPGDAGFVLLDLRRQTIPCAGMQQKHPVVGAMAVDLVAAQIHRGERGLPTASKLVLIDGDWVDGPTVEDRRGPAPDYANTSGRLKSR